MFLLSGGFQEPGACGFWGYLPCERKDCPCFMGAKWLKVVGVVAEMLQPGSP